MRHTPLRTLALIAAGTLLLTGCGRSDSTADTGSAARAIATGPASGTITVWAMGAEGEKLPELASRFEADNPGATVEITAIPWDSAHDKFTAAIAAGTLPDAAMVGTTWMGEFAGLGALDPTPAEIDTSVFFSGSQQTTVVDGVSYGVPWYTETRLLYYRTDLAAKAGVTQAPTDWAGLHDMAQAMQQKAGATWGIGLQAGGTGSWQTVLPFAYSAGATITDAQGYTFDTPQMLEAVSYYQSFFTDKIADSGAAATPTTEADFVSGKVPMFISGPWMMSAVEKVGGNGFADKYDVAAIPADELSASFVGGSDLVVFKNSDNRDAAWKFLQFLTRPDVQVDWFQLTTDLPAVASAWDDPALAGNTKLATFGTQLKTAVAPPSYQTWEQVAEQFDSGIEKITRTGADPSATLQEVQKQAVSIGTGR